MLEKNELSTENTIEKDELSTENTIERDDPSYENPLRSYNEVVLKKDFIESGVLVPKGSYCMIDSTGYVVDEEEAGKRYLLNPIGIQDEAGVEPYFLAKAEDFFRKKYETTTL